VVLVALLGMALTERERIGDRSYPIPGVNRLVQEVGPAHSATSWAEIARDLIY
jgi:hypothetical protein